MYLSGHTSLVFIGKCATYGINIPATTGTDKEWLKALDTFRREKGLSKEAKVFFVSANAKTPKGQDDDRAKFRNYVANQIDMRGFKFMHSEYCSIPNYGGGATVGVDGKGNVICQQS